MLINNAGIVGGKSFLEADDAMVQKTFEVNSISHFWTTKAFLPKMVENNHGHIGKTSNFDDQSFDDTKNVILF